MPAAHGKLLHARCPASVEPLFLPGAGHNDVEREPAFWTRLNEFFDALVAADAAGVSA